MEEYYIDKEYVDDWRRDAHELIDSFTDEQIGKFDVILWHKVSGPYEDVVKWSWGEEEEISQCPLCKTRRVEFWKEDVNDAETIRCATCGLIFGLMSDCAPLWEWNEFCSKGRWIIGEV